MSKKVPEYLPLSGLNLRGSVSPSTLESSCIKAAQDSEDPPPTRNTHPTGGGDAYLLTTYRTYPERWILLMTIFMLNVSTSVLWITYSAVSNIAADYFETSLSDINHLSVVYYLGYITFSLSASYVMHDRGLMSGLVIGAMLMVFSAWFRYLVVILPLTNMAKYYASLFAQVFLLSTWVLCDVSVQRLRVQLVNLFFLMPLLNLPLLGSRPRPEEVPIPSPALVRRFSTCVHG